ncbi:uncharacterized threonine-rich GPI-anchored glycoprotein PJ4664.02 isoform X2 [Ceratina calcarata]|nr:uncharacterized threonine-rich GPI-anchored glycoprotein PJ4664.02 isoform X2 [Ceratina calcarata]
MSLKHFRAAFTALVLWTWLVFSVTGWPTAAVGPSPTTRRRHESSAIASILETGDAKRDKSPPSSPTRPVRLNLHRLPPSPANLLKPDGFQFYTYNEKGEMITKQMTMQEIQTLIAGGGPDHSNGEVQEPQKAEDILSGGKKVMDVVEKVQNVLKSAMDKPLSSLTAASQPMIPEKANVEWSNILPAILAGDKYGNKVEEATPDPLSVSVAIQNSDSSKLDVNETDEPEAVTKYYAEQNATSSTIRVSETASTTEKLMIPVSVITTERTVEQTTKQHTVQNTVFNRTTRPDEYPNRENGSVSEDNGSPAAVAGEIKWTTIDAILPTSSVSMTSNNDSVTNKNETSDTEVEVNPTISTTIDDVKTPVKTQTPSIALEVETSVTSEPFATHSSTTTATTAFTGANKHNASSIVSDAITNLSEEPLMKPLSTELINSLSSVINQVSEKVSTVSLPSDDEQIRFQTVAHGETEDRHNDVSDVTPAATTGTAASSTIHRETDDTKNVTSTASTIEEKVVSSTSAIESSEEEKMPTTPVAILSSDATNQNHSTFLFNETKTPISNVTNFNYSSPIAIIESMLETASTEANLPATESLVLPNNLEKFSASTLASSLIAGLDLSSLNKTQTTQVPEQLNSTKIVTNSSLITNNENNTRQEDPAIKTELPSKEDNKPSQKEVEKMNATDVRNASVAPTTSSTESYHEQDQVSIVSESTLGTSNATLLSNNITVTEPTLFEITLTNESAVSKPSSTSEKSEEATELRTVEQNVSSNANKSVNNSSLSSSPLQKVEESILRIDSETNPTPGETRNASRIASKDESTTTERIEESTYRTTTDGNVSLTTASVEKSNATKEAQEQRPQVVDNSSTTATNLNETKSGHEGIVSTIAATITEVTKPPKVTSSENEEIKYSMNATTPALNSITKESKEGNETQSVTTATNTVNESENKTKDSSLEYQSHIGANASMEISTTSEMFRNNETIAGAEISSVPPTDDSNGTDISNHGWQQISLKQTTTSSPSMSTQTASTTTSTVPQTEQAEESTVSLAASQSIGGLDTSTRNASTDIVNFARLCNEIAIRFWISANKGLSMGRSLVVSPFGMTSLLAMIFLGARGSTSEQMNELLGLDNVATFNPHLIFQNVTDTVSLSRNQGVANAAFVRELFADKAKVRKLLPFYKEQAQQFYEGLVAEVNFATISDLARRRTNLLIRKQTGGRIKDFVKSNAVPLRSPLAAISANVFQTDCNTSLTSVAGRDGELYFAVSSSAHRLRKLVPVPATVWRSNVLAGYEPSLDATAIAVGGVEKIVSTIFILPGQQGHAAPGDTLDRLEQRLVKAAFRDGAWDKLLKVLIPRTGLELQIPKFSHRSVINATAALKRMGLDQLFSSQADFKGINGIGNRLFLSDVLQMNLFSTCGDEYVANGRHHVEIYPASPALRNSRDDEKLRFDDSISRSIEEASALARNLDKSEDRPRLKLDQPFLYFVRHNPTGFILHMGRFNPRLM